MRRLSVCCCLCAIPAFYTYARLTGVQSVEGRRINTHSPSLSHTPTPPHPHWHSQVIIMRGMHIIIINIFMIIPVICHSCCLHLRFSGLGTPASFPLPFSPPSSACQLGKLCAIFNFKNSARFRCLAPSLSISLRLVGLSLSVCSSAISSCLPGWLKWLPQLPHLKNNS